MADARRIAVPTLVTTGEPGLDHVVPVAGTQNMSELDSRRQAYDHRRHRPCRRGQPRPSFRRRSSAISSTNSTARRSLSGVAHTTMIRHLQGPAGRIEALLDDPGALCTTGDAALLDPSAPPITLRAAVVLRIRTRSTAAPCTRRGVFQVAKAFCRLGCAVLRFNFRGTGASQGTFDEGRGELLDFGAAVDYVAARYPGVEIRGAGVSFGAYVAMTAGATDDRVNLLVGLAVPAATHDYSAVRATTKPTYFIHGERDEFCPLRDVRLLYAQCREPKDLVVIDTADHLFSGHLTEMADAIEQLLGDAGPAGTTDAG